MIKPCKAQVVYLDNNATTRLCPDAKKKMIEWLDSCANASSDSMLAMKAKQMIESAKVYISKFLNTTLDHYSIIFTSGASESNCFIFRSIVDAYFLNKGTKPHIITSSIEHSSIIECVNHLEKMGLATITFIKPTYRGTILPQLVKNAIMPNTALISIMMANNEIGSINDIKTIGAIAHDHKIPFHTDAVQSFGKMPIHIENDNIDALSMSFHKIYGPVGIGLLCINNDLISGYQLHGQISGTQQNHLRGGTENIPAIAGAIQSLMTLTKNRTKKNKQISSLRDYTINELKKHIQYVDYKEIVADTAVLTDSFTVITEITHSMPGTLLLSFIRPDKKNPKENQICNMLLKKYLDSKKIIVSIGSACNTASKMASHVLVSIKTPQIVKKGVLRVSIGDYTKQCDIDKFVSVIANYFTHI